MKKVKVLCIAKSANEHSSIARFAAAISEVDTAQGKQRQARTVVNVSFADPKGADPFETGKEYVITIDKA